MATVFSVITPFGLSFTPITFQGPPPEPRPAVTDPLPQEKVAKEKHDKETVQQQKEMIHQQRQAENQKKQGWMSKLQSGLDEVAHQLEKTVETTVAAAGSKAAQMNDDHAFNRFRKAFPQFANEDLLLDQRCKLLTTSGVVAGFLQVSTSHLIFIGENQAQFFVPLNEILSIQLALSTSAHDKQPNFVPIFDDRTKPNALQIFTCGGQIIALFEFWSVTTALQGADQKFKDSLNILDHQWRKCVQVPRPDIQFLPYQQFQQPTWTPTQPVQLQQPAAAPAGNAPQATPGQPAHANASATTCTPA